MRIGELAQRSGTTTRALRYYESQGLLRSRRTSNGYREYDETAVRVVREIRTLVTIGFRLEDTRPFVECLFAGHESGDACPDSVATYRRKLAEIDACIDELRAARATISDAMAQAVARRETTCRACCP
ncbi:DNA-binding transcriptional MerR regulator [Herbihabitans rhizosphaerae]|uniref:DNA-binding transcriptional MerR regulator n=1 Tax=Herbihabitans rhizosphaerae TaxID=1872711 RepID=A0A4Q7L7C5_9PSEU|nr:MerR family transcriptional regulator [Herbihabitans rhizosphaerae]RZS45174.1 DNA-binding transcriptional MerR regulator [Herbihabitans rhizosphaerae]